MSLQFVLLRKSKRATFRMVDVVTITVVFFLLFDCTLRTGAAGEVTLSSSDMIAVGIPEVKRNRCDVTPTPNTQDHWEESLCRGGQ